ncbi:MAG: OmpA family protein [Bryobacteraceae bacterium]
MPLVARAEPPVPVAAPAVAPTPAPKPVEMTPTNRPVLPTAQNERRTMPPEVRASLNERLSHLEDAMFDFDKYTIRADASTALKDDVSVIREILTAYPEQKLLIEGHADERGSSEYNLALGDKRARAAEEFLSTMGIPANQLTVISYGKDRPVCTEQTEGCWQKNRRAHITAALN